ncbi:MAG TPA: site-specific integrase [Pyrinomonadaceae bacterium]|nr:site-specific integrase [Pyrinomonadaceae bacterium]
MYVRKRGLFWHYEFFVNGKRYTGSFNGKDGSKIAKDKAEAREFAYSERRKVLDGDYRDAAEREELKRFPVFVDRVFLPFARENHSSSDHDEFRCEMLKEYFKDRGFGEITVMTVVRFINDRLESETVRRRVLEDGTAVNRKRSPTTVNKEVTLLSSIFRMAIRERVATSNPCGELPKSVRAKIPARRRRNRRLSPEEEKSLFGVGMVGRREHLRPVTEAALCTGMRKGELFRLRREDLNFGPATVSRVVNGEVWDVPSGWLLIEKSKSGRPRVIPMSRRVLEILRRLCEDVATGEYVFRSVRTGGRVNDIKKGFAGACEEAGIDNFTFHDLRHTWSSRAAEMGVPEHVRRDILGHTPGSMTGDYTHASPEEMERAMESVASYKGRRSSGLGKISAKRKAAAGSGPAAVS